MPGKRNQIISFSGGKDSTAMLLMMLERNEPIHSIVFFDTGWEFPDMLKHIDKVEEYIDQEIIRLKPKKSFNYWMLKQPVIARKGPNKGQVHRIGNGWPSPLRRWCTRGKVNALETYISHIDNIECCVGYAQGEEARKNRTTIKQKKYQIRFPLIENHITEAKALKICQAHGFDWDGLYDHFRRVSCFCCPMQRIGELRNLRKYYPELWQKMLYWETQMQSNIGFKKYKTVHDLEKRFNTEEEHWILQKSLEPRP